MNSTARIPQRLLNARSSRGKQSLRRYWHSDDGIAYFCTS
jgi:hypothetical protein